MTFRWLCPNMVEKGIWAGLLLNILSKAEETATLPGAFLASQAKISTLQRETAFAKFPI